MIWGGKRYAGVQVYVGKQKGRFPGEYIVVYFCNGYSSGGYDAAVSLMEGQKFPSVSSTVSFRCLQEDYRPLSYRKIPVADRGKLAKWVME